MRIARPTIPHLATIDASLPTPRIPPLAHLALAVEVRARDVEAVDVAGDYAGDEEEGVD